MVEEHTHKPADDDVSQEPSVPAAGGSEPPEQNTAARGHAAAPGRGLGVTVLPALAILLAVLASLIAGTLWWQYRQFYVDLASGDADLQTGLEDVRAGLRVLRDDVQALQTGVDSGFADVDSLRSDIEVFPPELRALERRVDDLQGGRVGAREIWLREQAEYYLVLAGAELHVGGRVDSAITALEQADDVLRDLGDASLNRVRRSIAEEVQSLRAVELPDVDGIAAELAGLIRRVPDLSLRAAGPDNYDLFEGAGDDSEPGLGRLWERTKGAVTSIVRIERQDGPAGVVLTESERRIVRRQLALELQLARTALLEQRPETFRSALGAADALLGQDFDTGAQGIIETRRLLDDLASIELAPALPDIGDSLQLLRNSPGSE